MQAAIEALELIESRRTPCRECGSPHNLRRDGRDMPTWTDPNDGHGYYPLPMDEFARSVLDQINT